MNKSVIMLYVVHLKSSLLGLWFYFCPTGLKRSINYTRKLMDLKIGSSCSPIGATLIWQGVLGLDDAVEGTGVTDLLLELLNSLTCFCSSVCFALSALNPLLIGEANTCLLSWLGHALHPQKENALNKRKHQAQYLLHTFQILATKQLFTLDAFTGWKSGKMTLQDLHFCYCHIHNTSNQACRLVSWECYNWFAWFKIPRVHQSL